MFDDGNFDIDLSGLGEVDEGTLVDPTGAQLVDPAAATLVEDETMAVKVESRTATDDPFYNPEFNSPVSADKPTPAPSGAQVNTALDAPATAITQASEMAKAQFERTFQRAETLLESTGAAAQLREAGFGGIKKEHIKNLLLAYALYRIMRAVKSNLIPIAVLGGGVWAYMNREKLGFGTGTGMDVSPQMALNLEKMKTASALFS